MERPTTKYRNGEIVTLTDEEADAIWNEWQANLADLSAYKDDIDRRVQQLLDDTAKLYRYDNMQQVTQFATVDNEFNAEAVSLLAWNARVWELTEAHIANVTEIPNYDFIATLPEYETGSN